jgi:hypothetical protein
MAKEEEDRDPQYEEGDPSGSGGGSGGSGGEGGGSGGDKEVRIVRLTHTLRIRAPIRLRTRKHTRKARHRAHTNPPDSPSHAFVPKTQASDGDDSNGMDQERENSATRYSGSHREGHDDIGRGSRGASPDEIGQDARSTKRKESDEELGVDEEMVDGDGVDGSDEGSEPMHKRGRMNRTSQPAKAPPRFDFHDFPRKTNQADVANAAVTEEVRESRRSAIRAHAEVTASATAGVGNDKTSSKLPNLLQHATHPDASHTRSSASAMKLDTQLDTTQLDTTKDKADKTKPVQVNVPRPTQVKGEDGFAVPPPKRGAGGLPLMPPPHVPQEPVRVSGHPRVFGAAHRSIFIAGGGVVGHNIPKTTTYRGPPTPAASSGGNNTAALNHYIRSGKQVESVLGARPSLSSITGGFEYLVKWLKQAHVHCAWIEEDPLDQLAPAALGEYLLQHGRRPLMLMDPNWVRPQRVIAVHTHGGGGGGAGGSGAGSGGGGGGGGGGSNGGSGGGSGGMPDTGPGRGGQGAALTLNAGLGSHADSGDQRIPSPDAREPGSDGPGSGNGLMGYGAVGRGRSNSGSGGSDSGSDPSVCTKALVKWWGLPYDACTWEHVEVHPDLPTLTRQFREWSTNSLAASNDPTENGSTAAARAIAAAKKYHQKRTGSGGSGGSGSGSGSGGRSGGGSGAGSGGDGSGKGSAAAGGRLKNGGQLRLGRRVRRGREEGLRRRQRQQGRQRIRH